MYAETPLPPEPHAVPAARSFLRDNLQAWGLAAMVNDAELALSELVTNAVLHAGTPLGVSAACASGHVELAVFDGSSALPEIRPGRTDLAGDLVEVLAQEARLAPDLDERDPRLDVGAAGSVAGGRGLLLVSALVAYWGVTPQSEGKAVWARSPTPPGWAPPVMCKCHKHDDALPLTSGFGRVHDAGTVKR